MYHQQHSVLDLDYHFKPRDTLSIVMLKGSTFVISYLFSCPSEKTVTLTRKEFAPQAQSHFLLHLSRDSATFSTITKTITTKILIIMINNNDNIN